MHTNYLIFPLYAGGQYSVYHFCWEYNVTPDLTAENPCTVSVVDGSILSAVELQVDSLSITRSTESYAYEIHRNPSTYECHLHNPSIFHLIFHLWTIV